MHNAEQIERFFEDARHLANLWRIAGRWTDAVMLLHGLQPVAIELGNASIAKLWLSVAQVLTDQAMFGGQDTFTEREEALNLALTHAEVTNEPSLLGSIWDAKGFSLHEAYLKGDRSKEPEHELEFFERGLALREQVNQSRAISESLFHIGLVYGVVRRDHPQALPYFEKSYRLAQESEEKIIASYAMRHIAFAHYSTGDTVQARAELEESLHLREAAGFEPGVAMALLALASAEAELGDKSRALFHLEAARSIFEKLGATRRVEQVDIEIAQLA